MIIKLSVLLFLVLTNVYAIPVLITKKPLNYEEVVTPSSIKILNVQSLKKACIPVKINDIKNNKYVTTHYINKGSIICKRDVKKYVDNGVVFNFGAIQIEKKGKILQETDKFIRIKRPDGKIEKIYKDGTLK